MAIRTRSMFRVGRRSRLQRKIRTAGLGLAAAAAVGALIQYFSDPRLGRTRRVQAKDQVLAAVRRPAKRLRRDAETKRRYLRGRARGIAHELTTPPSLPADDRALVSKVRSEVLGAPRYSKYVINVDAVDGVVTLRGQLDRPEDIRELVAAVEKVPGVRDVANFLHLPKTTAPNVEGLQEPGS